MVEWVCGLDIEELWSSGKVGCSFAGLLICMVAVASTRTREAAVYRVMHERWPGGKAAASVVLQLMLLSDMRVI